ncbi:MurR/RpiR family transcriptional regulator [Endozoicomonas sp.]|uniref:MurR/RpiR family transcriptional regulator n=1 Tax=Endozoicomonas sp. TaxID=1892382 RepID=UPI002887D86F|nr:hypothetical protein [Endozoicomonas sp.]
MKQDSDYGLLARLRSRFDQLSPALAKINRFVTENPDTVIHQTLIELAEISGASEASVVRFCRDSGFKSFSEFRGSGPNVWSSINIYPKFKRVNQ